MRVSVVLPVYNGQEFLGETLDSVLRQRHTDLEIIAIDDGSSDGSVDVLNQYKPDIVLITQENAGVSAARNRGVERASGELIAFVDQDDIWYENKLERQVELYCDKGTEPFVYSDFDLINTSGRITNRCALESLRAQWMRPFIGGLLHPYPSTTLMKRSLFLEVGGFDAFLKGNGYEDVDLWIRLYGSVSFEFIPEALVQYRIDHKHRVKKKVSFETASENHLYMYKKLEARFGSDPDLKEGMNRFLAAVHAHKGKACVFRGDPKQARGHFKEAYRLDPENKRHGRRYWRTFLPSVLQRHTYSR